jgi:hypothetical protein
MVIIPKESTAKHNSVCFRRECEKEIAKGSKIFFGIKKDATKENDDEVLGPFCSRECVEITEEEHSREEDTGL